jgi:hypothetical protein
VSFLYIVIEDVIIKALWVLTLWLRMKSVHAFRKLIKCINVKLIIGNYSRKNITNALIRLSNHCNHLSNLRMEGGKLPSSGHGCGHVSEVVMSRSAALRRWFFSSALVM